MPYYLSRTNLGPEAWARMIGNPEDRRAAARAGADDYKGRLVGYWYSTGRYDTYALMDAPDNVAAAAVRSALFASGAFADYHHTVLMTVEEMKIAATKIEEWPTLRDYRPPGAVEASEQDGDT